jgi:hypothetical protein
MTHLFLSDEWMAAAHEIREKYADQVPPVTTVIKINQVIIDVPFGDGEVRSYLDTSSGHLVMELGELDDADATVTTDYDTAKATRIKRSPCRRSCPARSRSRAT